MMLAPKAWPASVLMRLEYEPRVEMDEGEWVSPQPSGTKYFVEVLTRLSQYDIAQGVLKTRAFHRALREVGPLVEDDPDFLESAVQMLPGWKHYEDFKYWKEHEFVPVQ